MEEKNKEIYSNTYLSLFDNGEIGINDGVGYIDTLDKEESFKLYLGLKKLFDKNRDVIPNDVRVIIKKNKNSIEIQDSTEKIIFLRPYLELLKQDGLMQRDLMIDEDRYILNAIINRVRFLENNLYSEDNFVRIASRKEFMFFHGLKLFYNWDFSYYEQTYKLLKSGELKK